MHSVANALIAKVLPEPDGPKNKKYDILSNFSLRIGEPNYIPINSAKPDLNYG